MNSFQPMLRVSHDGKCHMDAQGSQMRASTSKSSTTVGVALVPMNIHDPKQNGLCFMGTRGGRGLFQLRCQGEFLEEEEFELSLEVGSVVMDA